MTRLRRLAAIAASIGFWIAAAGGAQRLSQVSQCRYSNQCSEPMFCQGGTCVVQCQDDRDCLYGYLCTRPAPEPGATIAPDANFANSNVRCLPPGVHYYTRLQNGEWSTVLEDSEAYLARRVFEGAYRGYAQPSAGANIGTAQSGSSPRSIGGVVGVAQPAPSGAAGGAYFRGADGALWVRSANGQEQPTSAGAISTADLVSVARPSGEVTVIHRADTNEIWRIDCHASQCGPWIDLGGQLKSAPTAWLDAYGGIVVRGLGMDGATWQTTLDGQAKSGWQPVDK